MRFLRSTLPGEVTDRSGPWVDLAARVTRADVVRAVGAVAAVKIGVAALGIPPSAAATYPVSPWIPVLLVASFVAAGGWLLSMGRGDSRAQCLGVLFLLSATPFCDPLLASLALRAGPIAPLVRLLGVLQLAALIPWLLWLFVGEFPRARLHGRAARLSRAGTSGALACGIVLVAANLLPSLAPRGDPRADALRWLSRSEPGSLFWPLLFLAGLLTIPLAVQQFRHTTADERRRVRIVQLTLLAGSLPLVGTTLVAALIPGFGAYLARPEGVARFGLVVYPMILTIPLGIAYAVLVHRALEVRLIVRAVAQYALARYSVILISVAPFCVMLALLYVERQNSLASIFTTPAGWMSAGALGAGGVLVRSRERVLDALDRRFFREQYDARLILSGLVDEIRHTRSPGEVAATLRTGIEGALHVRGVALLLRDARAGELAAPDGSAPPLDLAWSVVQRLEHATDVVMFDGGGSSSWESSLREPERGWMRRTAAAVGVPVLATDGALLGLILLGEKRSGLPYSREDRALLRTIAGSLGLALEARRPPARADASGDTPDARETDEVASECLGCGSISGPGTGRCRSCGDATVAAIVPLLLAGKYRLMRRLGNGAMGVVYQGVDLALQRTVAIKTLPVLSSEQVRRLRREARMMASVGHPNLVGIFGIESFQGRPMLVTEHLAGGTLHARLTRGALPVEAVFEVGAQLSLGLARLHAAGILHRDIKPSNIGFSGDDVPKLLDFGLARVFDESPPGSEPDALTPHPQRVASMLPVSESVGLAGTPLYLSPEALAGAPPSPGFDLWALALVMLEAVIGGHPLLRADSARAWRTRLAMGQPPDMATILPGLPPAVVEFFRDALAPEIAERPANALALRQRTVEVAATLGPPAPPPSPRGPLRAAPLAPPPPSR